MEPVTVAEAIEATAAEGLEAGERALPDGWCWVRLRNVCEINPRRPAISRPDEAHTSFVPMSAVAEDGRGITEIQLRPFAEVRTGYTYFADGDVLFAKITPCMQNGKHAIARNLLGGIGFGSTEFHVLRPGNAITADWVHYLITQPDVLTAAEAHFFGAVGQQRVPQSYLENLLLPLPPLAEQQRIVAALDEQIATVERARAAAQAQLSAAHALPAAYLRAVFESDEARQWPHVRLGDIAGVSGGIQKTPNRAPSTFFRPFLTVRNVQRSSLDLSDIEHFEVTPAELERFRLESGDLLIVEGNGSPDQIGRNAIFRGEIEECVHQNHLIRVRLNRTQADADFVSYLFNSDQGKEQMTRMAGSTTGLHTLSVSKVERLEVVLPDIAEQQRIVTRLEEQMAEAQQLREALEAELAAINALPAALLRRAFRGEL